MDVSRTQATPPRPFPLTEDIVINVMKYSHPEGIQALRGTSHVGYYASHARSVWLDALERVVESYGIFVPTFPLSQMSTLDLERAALAPSRFLRALQQHDSREGQPLPQRNYSFPCQVAFPGHTNRLFSVHLVPGGRFLFTFTGDGIFLWDLGYGGDIPDEMTPLAELNTPGLWWMDVTPSANGRELVVAVMKFAALGSTLEVHQINPVSPDPTFHRVRHLDVPHEPQREIFFEIQLTQDTVHLYCEPFIAVWNWANNTGVKWNLRRHLRQISPCNESIIAVDVNNDICVWDFPSPSELPSLTGVEVTDLRTIENTPKYSFPAPRSHKNLTLLRTSRWQHSLSSDRHLCAIAQRREYKDSLSLYSIKSVPGFPLKTLPVPAGRCGLVYGKDMRCSNYEGGATAINRINDNLVFCTGSRAYLDNDWYGLLDYGHSELVASVLPMPDPSLPALHEIKPKAVVLTSGCHNVVHGRGEKNQFAFCPFSGRLVYMATECETGNWGVELRIADYLWTPTR